MHTKRVKKSKKQRLYTMKGCSKRKCNSAKRFSKRRTRKYSIGGDAPIAPYSLLQGGTCSSCLGLNGGSTANGALVGQPWSVLTSGNENYLAKNLYNKADPQTMMQIRGGKKRRHKKKGSIKGGGLIPSDLVNFGRDITYNINSAYNALNGEAAPASPSPYEGQLTKSISESRIII
jgi:hypothetical protein